MALPRTGCGLSAAPQYATAVLRRLMRQGDLAIIRLQPLSADLSQIFSSATALGHRDSPSDMSVKIKHFGHITVAILEVCISRVIAVSPSQ
jgi:hypothetical protein